MRRKIGIISTMVLVVVCLCVAIAMLATDPAKKVNKGKSTEDSNEKREYLTVVSRVYYGSLESTHACRGTVNNNEENYLWIEEYEISPKNNVEMLVNIGDMVNIGDELISIDGKIQKCDTEGLVSDIVKHKEKIFIEIIEFERLYIDIDITYDVYEKIGYDSKVQILENKSLIDGKIINKGYRMDGEYIRTKIGFDKYILPGKEVEVLINLGTTKEMLYIPSFAVHSINGVSYCYVEVADRYVEERQVVIGDEYVVLDNGNSFHYTEIISGLSEGEIVGTYD